MTRPSNRTKLTPLRKTFAWPVVMQSLLVALVVGLILNIINQGPEIIAGKPVNLMRLVLTFAVPFFVASYGAYSAFSADELDDQ